MGNSDHSRRGRWGTSTMVGGDDGELRSWWEGMKGNSDHGTAYTYMTVVSDKCRPADRQRARQD